MPCGVRSSSTMMVMRIAITPSLNASRRPLDMLTRRSVPPGRSQPLEPVERALVAHVAGVERGGGLEQHHLRLALGHGTVLHAARHDQELAGLEVDVPVAKL